MKKQTKIHYDSEADVLYISFGEPRPSYSEDFEEGIYLRYDMETDELTGVTILDFAKRKHDIEKMPFPIDLPFGTMNNIVH